MGSNYYQLDFDERIELDRLHDAGCSKREISRRRSGSACVLLQKGVYGTPALRRQRFDVT